MNLKQIEIRLKYSLGWDNYLVSMVLWLVPWISLLEIRLCMERVVCSSSRSQPDDQLMNVYSKRPVWLIIRHHSSWSNDSNDKSGKKIRKNLVFSISEWRIRWWNLPQMNWHWCPNLKYVTKQIWVWMIRKEQWGCVYIYIHSNSRCYSSFFRSTTGSCMLLTQVSRKDEEKESC